MDLGTIKMHIKLTLRIPVRRRHGRKIEICTERQFAKKLIATSIYISTYNINMAWITTKTIFMMKDVYALTQFERWSDKAIRDR